MVIADVKGCKHIADKDISYLAAGRAYAGVAGMPGKRVHFKLQT